MGTITYENEAMAFTADYQDLIDQLNKNIREHNVEDDGILLQWLRDKTDNGKNDISITESIRLSTKDSLFDLRPHGERNWNILL